MKKIKKILMFSILLVLPFLFSSKVFAFDYIDAFIGKTRLVEGSTSDSMHIEFETDNGFVEFNDLSLMLSDYNNLYSDKSYVGYIFSFPMSLKNPTSSGTAIKLYPAGTTLVLSIVEAEVPVAVFFSANWEELDVFIEEDLTDHYFEYDLFIDDYFVGYNQGYLAGYDEGLIDGDLAGYEDGLIDGDQAGYERGYLAGYENGYLAGQEDQVPNPTPPGSGVIVPPQESSKTKYIIITVLVIGVLTAAAYYIYTKKYKSKAKRK